MESRRCFFFRGSNGSMYSNTYQPMWCDRSFASSLGAIDLVLAAMKAFSGRGICWDFAVTSYKCEQTFVIFSRKVSWPIWCFFFTSYHSKSPSNYLGECFKSSKPPNAQIPSRGRLINPTAVNRLLRPPWWKKIGKHTLNRFDRIEGFGWIWSLDRFLDSHE